MCNLSQEILQTGFEQGMEKGMEQGELKAKKEVALELHEMGMSISQIAKAAKVSEEQIHAWILGEK